MKPPASAGRGDGPATEFPATVAAWPASWHTAGDSLPGDGLDSLPAGTDSNLPSDLPGDSLPAPPDGALQQQPTLSRVGRYELKTLLGSGGLGQVHEAWDPLLSRAVAVKTLQFTGEASTRDHLDRLILDEARAVASLNHRHIVTVYDAGLSAAGVYLAMERLRGRDLRQALAEGWRPTPREAAQLVRRVADALAYAHERGVVHCDIKPANIFLDHRRRPRLLDFGIARIAHRATVPALDGLLLGSPHYLSPEQLQGQPADARTDLHALGTVLYELLCGRKAYPGQDVAEISAAVLAGRAPPAHEVQPDVPLPLSAIAARAMATQPADRWQTAAQMARALRRWSLRDERLQARQAARAAGPVQRTVAPEPAPGGLRPAGPVPAPEPAPASAAPATRAGSLRRWLPGTGWLLAAVALGLAWWAWARG